MINTAAEFAIVGGGVIGMMTALEVRASTSQTVHLYEKNTLGTEASWAGGGILSPLYPWRYPEAVNALAGVSAALYRQWSQGWQTRGLDDPQLLASGLLVLDEDQVLVGKQWAENHQSAVSAPDGLELSRIEPALVGGFSRALLFPEVDQIRNPRLRRTLHQALLGAGVQVHENAPVERVCTESGRVVGLSLLGRRVDVESVVLAAGSWSPELLDAGVARPPIRPVKGQMILLQAQPGQLRHIILYKGRYLIPRADGRILVGSTMEELGFDKTPTEAAARDLRAAAEEIVPSLKDCPMIAHWAGLRPGSPDGVPFIGRHPEIEGLYLNVGHFRNGLCTAPASARLLADLMLGREPILDPAPYRFGPDENA